MKTSISIKLFNTLQKGKELLTKEALQRIACFVDSQRIEDESFMDKSGKSDVYYTVFGWMLAYVLDIRINTKKAEDYLESIDTDTLDLIHYAAYMRCRMLSRLMGKGKVRFFINTSFSTGIRALDSFNGLPHNDPHSPYSQFIWLSLLEDTGNRIKDKESMVEILKDYRAGSGGYMNTRNGLTATTNATVAALAVAGQLNGYRKNADIRFLLDLQNPSGGFAAAEASPLPDLLSTATSLFLLSCYGLHPDYPARDFIEAHWLDTGGFVATLLDGLSDVEYTFYGLLALGAINTV